jgi:hypothetical protein
MKGSVLLEKLVENKRIFIAKTAQEVKMIFDPYRLRILHTIFHNKAEMTVKQIATEMEEPANKVHYHVKKLSDYKALKLVRTENINGIIAKYYMTAYDGYILDPEGGNKEVYDLTKKSLFSNLDMAVDKFKKDMVSYMNLISEKGKEAQRGLEISYDKYYMTKEEKEKVIKEIHEVLQKYTKEDTTKEEYSMIHTLARIK